MKHKTQLKNDIIDQGINPAHITRKDEIICDYLDALENRIDAMRRQISVLKRSARGPT